MADPTPETEELADILPLIRRRPGEPTLRESLIDQVGKLLQQASRLSAIAADLPSNTEAQRDEARRLSCDVRVLYRRVNPREQP